MAEPHAVAPARTRQHEGRGYGIRFARGFGVHHEGRAVEVRLREQVADFQFLAHHERTLRAHHAEARKASAGAALHGFEAQDVAQVLPRTFTHQVSHLCLRELHLPPVKFRGRLVVVVVEHLAEDVLVGGVAEGVGTALDPCAGVVLGA